MQLNQRGHLNQRGLERCNQMLEQADSLRLAIHQADGEARVVDCGVRARGGLEAGRGLAEVCLAGLGRVNWTTASAELGGGPAVQVGTDQPVAGCMASQYAGWQISGDGYFGMGSGPMRAAAGKESLFDSIGCRERPAEVIGVLESGKLPPSSVTARIAEACGVEPPRLTLLVAPTSSLAGTVQVVARSVETALHKMHELKFDLSRVVSGFGVAPLPPVSADDLVGIGRTNDAVLYGGQVTLWVDDDDAELQRLGPQIPSNASSDYGQPFARLFEQYERDFYRIDPLLFSPAVVTLVNVRSGRSFRFGQIRADVVRASFATEGLPDA